MLVLFFIIWLLCGVATVYLAIKYDYDSINSDILHHPKDALMNILIMTILGMISLFIVTLEISENNRNALIQNWMIKLMNWIHKKDKKL